VHGAGDAAIDWLDVAEVGSLVWAEPVFHFTIFVNLSVFGEDHGDLGS